MLKDETRRSLDRHSRFYPHTVRMNTKYWDEWVDPKDMEIMWAIPRIREEWIKAGEVEGQKVHFCRNPDGQPCLSLLEIRALASIIVDKHFRGHLDPMMVCAVADIESDRQPFAYHYEPNLKEGSIGLMQILQSTAEWLAGDLGYRAYVLEPSPTMLYKPFTSIYFGAAFLKWLSMYKGKKRNEEFIVRAYSGGPKFATHKSTLQYFKNYELAKESLLSVRFESMNITNIIANIEPNRDYALNFWEDRVSPSDMMAMWNHPSVKTEWLETGSEEGRVCFQRDSANRVYLSRVELKAVAEIVVTRYFPKSRVHPALLAALAEISSERLLCGSDSQSGITGISFPTALWIFKDVGYREYKIECIEDLYNPFVSMYFAAAYACWLSTYEGRERTEQFIVEAYMGGPESVNVQITGSFWKNYLTTLQEYQIKKKRSHGKCTIL